MKSSASKSSRMLAKEWGRKLHYCICTMYQINRLCCPSESVTVRPCSVSISEQTKFLRRIRLVGRIKVDWSHSVNALSAFAAPMCVKAMPNEHEDLMCWSTQCKVHTTSNWPFPFELQQEPQARAREVENSLLLRVHFSHGLIGPWPLGSL
jgi:hypothetical protein